MTTGARSGGAPPSQFRAVVAAQRGWVSAAGGALVLRTADGGLGTGNGLGGGIVAMALGLISMVLGGLTLIRSRHPN
ncbi:MULTISPECIES: DUF6223 family protein [Nocardia]|uniref:DUF6223 family protein n=1 Tax=Nocardia abscessus TaxID=120957 RepID=UPI001892E2EA|nr:DUF6223 family protein [Nocardia abscessus]MBF6475222.1 hypothetical protein [Nocardia abscessus]